MATSEFHFHRLRSQYPGKCLVIRYMLGFEEEVYEQINF